MMWYSRERIWLQGSGVYWFTSKKSTQFCCKVKVNLENSLRKIVYMCVVFTTITVADLDPWLPRGRFSITSRSFQDYKEVFPRTLRGFQDYKAGFQNGQRWWDGGSGSTIYRHVSSIDMYRKRHPRLSMYLPPYLRSYRTEEQREVTLTSGHGENVAWVDALIYIDSCVLYDPEIHSGNVDFYRTSGQK